MPPPEIGRRRSSRIPQEHAIEVTGTNIDGVDFLAHSRTLILSRHGAKIHLEQGLGPDQQISIYNPETGRECLAKVGALYDRGSDGYSYGIEFLDPALDFWNLVFPSGPEPGAVPIQEQESVAAPGAEHTVQPSSKPHAMGSEEPPRAAAGNDYLVRMMCPHGGETTWMLLRNRGESQQQILKTPWDFPCQVHGLQRELPMQVREAPQGVQPSGEPFATVDLCQVEAEHRKQRKSEIRSPKAVRVWVSGVDPHGNPFSQSAYSLDISKSGARLYGVGFLTEPGKNIQVKRGWKKALFRVAWVGQAGSYQADQLGIRCLEPGKNIWGLRPSNNDD